MTKTIIITGTHHTPAHQLINLLKKDSIHWEIHYLGRKYNFQDSKTLSVEYQLFPPLGVHFHSLQSGRFNRRSPLKTLIGLPSLVCGLFRSYQLVKKIKPDITVSFGGYISVPVIVASYLHHVPCLTHEQTGTLSLSTKLNSFFVNKVALSFNIPGFAPQKTVLTGNLLRQEVLEKQSPGPFIKIKKALKKPKKLLYITGGNQGASFINQIILEILPVLIKKNYLVIHQTGNRDYPQVKKQTRKYPPHLYHPLSFVSSQHLGWVLKNTDLMISRSGANICQEIAAFHKKAILIPLPQSQNKEQEKNALWTKKYAPVRILAQDHTSPQKLLDTILEKYKPRQKYPSLNFEASAQKLLKLIRQLSS
jgi:UDP-N-acetylglucosamine--N-acetylmuramyl-(pentapeptide) pyrophosphoryl-undecaprenol N-acetylglucosamine transferase